MDWKYADEWSGPVYRYRSTLRPASELGRIPAQLITPGSYLIGPRDFETYEPLEPAWMAHMSVVAREPETVKRADLFGNVLDTFATEGELNGYRESQGRML